MEMEYVLDYGYVINYFYKEIIKLIGLIGKFNCFILV